MDQDLMNHVSEILDSQWAQDIGPGPAILEGELNGTIIPLKEIWNGRGFVRVRGEAEGDPEWSLRITPRVDLSESFFKQVRTVLIAGTRYAKRTLDPPRTDSSLWLMRVQPIGIA